MGWIIAIANPKGGTGKTTSAVTLAEQFSAEGERVAVLDLDGQQTVAKWHQHRTAEGRETPFHVEGYPPTHPIEGLIPKIRNMAGATDYLILDLEGIASLTMSRAMSRAHLVIVPIAPRHLDGEGAAVAVTTIADEEDVLGRIIPYRVLLNRAAVGGVTPAAQTRIVAGMDEVGIRRYRTFIREGRPFDDIWVWHMLLTEQLQNADTTIHESGSNRATEKARQQILRALADTSGFADETKTVLAEIAGANHNTTTSKVTSHE